VVPCSEENSLSKHPFSSQESQEKQASPGHVEEFSRIVISFCIKFGYTSIGWSDD